MASCGCMYACTFVTEDDEQREWKIHSMTRQARHNVLAAARVVAQASRRVACPEIIARMPQILLATRRPRSVERPINRSG
jgi:hypothetical protein